MKGVSLINFLVIKFIFLYTFNKTIYIKNDLDYNYKQNQIGFNL